MYTKLLPLRFLEESYKYKFYKKFYRNSENECWLWFGAKTKDKAGTQRPYVKLLTISYYASRVMYFIHYKQDPKEQIVCHTCDNEMCKSTPYVLRNTSN